MYIIQVNQQSWLKGIWRGWLACCNSPSEALVYKTLSTAERAVNYYSQLFPSFKFAALPLYLLKH